MTTVASAVFFFPFSFSSPRSTTHLEVGLVLDLIEVVQRGAVVQLVKGDDLREGEVWEERGAREMMEAVSMG